MPIEFLCSQVRGGDLCLTRVRTENPKDRKARHRDRPAALPWGPKPESARAGKLNEIKFTPGSDNVFEDLGFDRAEAANVKIRADLMIELREYIKARGWTQAEAADFFGETHPRISNLLKGEISRFSIDKLINMLARAGLRVSLETKPRAA